MKATLRVSRPGFSLVEVLIGMLILAIGLASAFTLTVTTSRHTAANRNLATAANLAEYKIEELRNASAPALVSGADPTLLNALGQADAAGLFSRAWVVTNDMPETGLRTVVVSVSWSELGPTRTYTLSGVL
jgi:prepilin-type N-terminal cleavage/methylation domain-containing protein